MAIPAIDDPARRVVVVPLVLVPTLKTEDTWSYTTGGAVIPAAILRQRNERVVAWFGGTIYVVEDGGIGEAQPFFYTPDTYRHVELPALAIRSDTKGRQAYIAGPFDVTTKMPNGTLLGVRAGARSVGGLEVSFFHLTLTFMVQ